MKKFVLSGSITVGVFTYVNAESIDAARAIAEARGMQSLCHQCNGGNARNEWTLGDGLEGQVEISEVAEAQS